MKMIYQDIYDIIDQSMSDSQIGSRKDKNIRNHVWVVNSVICDVNSSKNKKQIFLKETRDPCICHNCRVNADKLLKCSCTLNQHACTKTFCSAMIRDGYYNTLNLLMIIKCILL